MEALAQYVYVASSWRNIMQAAVVEVIKAAGIGVYDFRHPAPEVEGFHWGEVLPGYKERLITVDEYRKALDHPIAVEGYRRDFEAMEQATHGVLVMPCGRSAHSEAGWMAGRGTPVCVLLEPDAPVDPELMYKMYAHITDSMLDLLDWLGVKD